MLTFVSVVATVCIVTVCIVATRQRRARMLAEFRQRFPPIDDQEFLRRRSPGVNAETALRVRRVVAEQLGIDYDRVYPEQSFVDDLDFD